MKRLFIFLIIIQCLLVSVTAKAQGLIIPSNTYVIANEGNLILQGGSWINNGSFTHNSGVVIFSGTTQSLSGASSSLFNNLTITSGSNTTVNSDQLLKGVLLSNGTLNANSKLTLTATAAQTAMIDGSGVGNVLGNLTMQGYFSSGFGYKYLSSPFQGATVNEFSDDINLSATFPALYKYEENQVSSGWVNYTASSGTLSPLKGYTVNLGTSSAAKTIDIIGVVNNGTVSATLFNNNKTYTKGFNLAGNPYPSPIDWNSVNGWTKTNIDNAIYYFKASSTDQYSGTYSTYINGVSSDGTASNIIPAMQGFFVHVTDGTYPVSATLSVNNVARTIIHASNRIMKNNGDKIKSSSIMAVTEKSDSKKLIRLTARIGENVSHSDPAVIYFDDMATVNFDKEKDALKMMNTDVLIPNLYTLSKNGLPLSINALPFINDSASIIPLGLKTEKSGWITLDISGAEHISPSLQVYLSDATTGINQNLRIKPKFSLQLEAGKHENRFSLVFSQQELTEKLVEEDWFKAYGSYGRLYITLSNLNQGERGNLIISNLLGQVLWKQELSDNGSHEISPQLNTGTYIVSFISSRKGTRSKKVVLNNDL